MPVIEKLVWTFECGRCGHGWIPKQAWAEGEALPAVCPSCKSPYWNRARANQEEAPPADYIQVALVPGWQEAFANGRDPADGNSIYGLWRLGPGQYRSVRVLATREGEVQVQTVEPTRLRPREVRWVSADDAYIRRNE